MKRSKQRMMLLQQDLLNKLRAFHENGAADPEAVRKLLEELDETRNKKE